MKVESSATVFTVKNLEESLDFYKNLLGFKEDFIVGNYAGVKKGKLSIHLAQAGNEKMKPVGTGNVYIFCDEIDTYFDQLKLLPVKVISECPASDGNIISL